MPGHSRRTVQYLGLVILTTVVFTVIYNTGMTVWEGRPQPIYRSLEVVIQSFTTTGYGEDAPWQTAQMHLLVIMMQFAGIGLILTAVDVFAVPWLRNAVTPSLPESIPELSDHIIICGYTPRTRTFLEDLETRDREYVFVETDADLARDLHEADHRVVHGDPESSAVLDDAHIDEASVIVADVADDVNASIALTARDANPEIRVITLLEDDTLSRYHEAAGVNSVLSPRQLLGESLAAEVPTAVTVEFEDEVDIDEDIELVELTVADGSELEGKVVREANLRERFGVNAIGVWADGDFVTPIDQDEVLSAGMRLLVVGAPDRVDEFRDAISTNVKPVDSGRIVIAGYGDSGQAAAQALGTTRTHPTILDIEPKEGVDIVGDAREPSVLEEAGINEASTLLLTLADDTTAIFTTLIARELNPRLRIVVRANQENNVQKLYRAGASYVQSLATVSGRMLASTVFEDETVLSYDTKVSVVRLPAGGLAGQTLADARVRTVTGCTVLAVIRDEETITRFDPAGFTFQSDDDVVLVGSDESISRFEREFGP